MSTADDDEGDDGGVSVQSVVTTKPDDQGQPSPTDTIDTTGQP